MSRDAGKRDMNIEYMGLSFFFLRPSASYTPVTIRVHEKLALWSSLNISGARPA